MASDLRARRCEACQPGTKPLPESDAADLQGYLEPAWERTANTSLRRLLRFNNFRDAFGFATRVALLAEEEGHHPDLEIGWGRLAIVLTTHAAKGLTENDFILAAKVDELAEGLGFRS